MFKGMKQTFGKKACALALCALMLGGVPAAAWAEDTVDVSVTTTMAADSTSSPQSDTTSQPNNPSTDAAAGQPYVTSYTVTDSAGNEKQQIAEGEKCRIIVGVVDPRIKSITLPNGQPLGINIKVASTGAFNPPSLGDISNTTLTESSLVKDATGNITGLMYSIILNDITYLGGTSNALALDISYNNQTLPLAQISLNVTQCVSGQSEGGKASTLVIKSAGYGSGDVTAGQNFTLTTTVLMTGSKSGAENVAVSLTLPEEITVVSGSSYYFVGDMKPGTSMDVQFLLTASAVAKAGSYNISIDVTGNSAADGATLSAKMPITVPIIQPDRFEISRAEIPENMMVGQESYGTVALVNKGKGSVYNVEAKLEGEGFTVDEGANKFIGNIASGTESAQDFSITPTQGGTITMQLVVSYEDEKANVKTLTRDFTVTVDEMMEPDPGIVDPGIDIPVEEPSQGIPVWVWVLVALVVAGAAAVVIVVVRKKKKQRLNEKLMEDDDEDI